MVVMEGGTTFETVSISDSVLFAPGPDRVLQHPRSSRLSAFDRAPTMRPTLAVLDSDLDFGKSAWKSSSNIWSTHKALLVPKADDEVLRRTYKTLSPVICDTDERTASPLRQTSARSFGPTRLTGHIARTTSIDSNIENFPQGQGEWNK